MNAPKLMRGRGLLLTVVAVVATAVPALAQTAYCERLQAEYVALDRYASPAARPSPHDYRRIVRALSDAQNQAYRLGCRGGFGLFSRSDRRCGGVLARIDRLEGELRRTQGQTSSRRGGFFGYDPEQQERRAVDNRRNRIRDEMYRSGCSDPSQSRPTGVASGGYRTLCVRVCDGYYFPISFSTKRSKLADDEKTCQALYPAAQAELFVHRTSQTSEAMVSLNNENYVDRPYAFAYRQSYNAACPSPGMSVELAAASTAATTELETEARAAAIIPVPPRRPAPAADPETMANMVDDFVPTPEPPPLDLRIAGVGSTTDRRIRVVGPSYYYTLDETSALPTIIPPKDRADAAPIPAAEDAGPEQREARLKGGDRVRVEYALTP